MPRRPRNRNLFSNALSGRRTRPVRHPRFYSETGSRRRAKLASPYAGRFLPGFPKTQNVMMRFVENTQIDAAAGLTAFIFYRANSINDPRNAIGGAQPLGHDQWNLFYNHYLVVSSKITIKMIGSSANEPGTLSGIYLSDDTAVPATAPLVQEQGLSTYKVASLSTNSDLHALTLSSSFNAKKFYNITDIKDNFNRLGAPFGQNPTEEAFYTIYQGALNLLAEPGRTDVNVMIEYNVILSEPKSLDPS